MFKKVNEATEFYIKFNLVLDTKENIKKYKIRRTICDIISINDIYTAFEKGKCVKNSISNNTLNMTNSIGFMELSFQTDDERENVYSNFIYLGDFTANESLILEYIDNDNYIISKVEKYEIMKEILKVQNFKILENLKLKFNYFDVLLEFNSFNQTQKCTKKYSNNPVNLFKNFYTEVKKHYNYDGFIRILTHTDIDNFLIKLENLNYFNVEKYSSGYFKTITVKKNNYNYYKYFYNSVCASYKNYNKLLLELSEVEKEIMLDIYKENDKYQRLLTILGPLFYIANISFLPVVIKAMTEKMVHTISKNNKFINKHTYEKIKKLFIANSLDMELLKYSYLELSLKDYKINNTDFILNSTIFDSLLYFKLNSNTEILEKIDLQYNKYLKNLVCDKKEEFEILKSELKDFSLNIINDTVREEVHLFLMFFLSFYKFVDADFRSYYTKLYKNNNFFISANKKDILLLIRYIEIDKIKIIRILKKYLIFYNIA